MQSNRLAFAALALACIAAAGAGGYLANRSVTSTQAIAGPAVADTPQAAASPVATTPITTAAQHESSVTSTAASVPPTTGSSTVSSPSPRAGGANMQGQAEPLSPPRDAKRDDGRTSRPATGPAATVQSVQDTPAASAADAGAQAPSSDERAVDSRGQENRSADKGATDSRTTEVRTTSS